jgi:TPR repeat protein
LSQLPEEAKYPKKRKVQPAPPVVSKPVPTPKSERIKPLAFTEKINAPTSNDPESQYQYAVWLEDEDANSLEAARWFKLAADQGHGHAAFKLAELYATGIGVNQSISLANKYYQIAEAAGFKNSVRASEIVPPNEISPSPNSSNSPAVNDAEMLFKRGVMHEQGIGGVSNFKNAVAQYRLAALQGHKKAQFKLSLLYRKGLGVEQNLAEADRWLTLSNKPDTNAENK